MRIRDALNEAAGRFGGRGIENPLLDAEVVLASVLGVPRHKLLVDRDAELLPAQAKKYFSLVKRREEHEPVAYITGTREFYSLEFQVNPSVLIPRPETELLVDLALYYAPLNASVLDVGTGSGAIAIAVKFNRGDVIMHAVDISESAVRLARKNARKILGSASIRFSCGSLFETSGGRRFDLIVSNPPYIARSEAPSLPPDLKYEPDSALFAKNGGRAVIEGIIKKSGAHLTENGIILMEISPLHREFVLESASRHGYRGSVISDYSGLPRVAVLTREARA